jgi:thiol-disulfide isomerase/thioredoxin
MTVDLATTEARIEFLLEVGVLVEEANDELAVSEAYDSEHGVYYDTYADIDDDTFHETLASLFGMTVDEARTQTAELGITREELVAYLSLRGYFKRQAPETAVDDDELLHLAGLIAGVSPTSPVPDILVKLTDENYTAFLESNSAAVVWVWRLHCEPCDAMKADMDAILDVVPPDVAVAGIDGEAVTAFRQEFDVDAAPATLTFVNGDVVEVVTGRKTPEQLDAMFTAAFDQAGAP